MRMKIFPEEETPEGTSVEFSMRRPNFLDLNSPNGSNNGNDNEKLVRPQLFELGRSMSAPPAEFLSSIQSVN